MTARQDPYRVLGLVPGATPGEIRSAYRRLAKLYHPDAAGDRAVARFLAIQAAYEELLDAEGRLRTRGSPGRGGGAGAGRGAASSPRASRDAWRARRDADGTGASAGSKGQATGAKGHAAGAGRAAGAGPKSGADGASHGQRAGGSPGHRTGTRPGGRPRPERKTARPGSTTYDEATQPLDPAWDGATWYGASSGRYWTLNPREYADPRKHGPEYQERARRAARLEAARRARMADAASPTTTPTTPAEEPSSPEAATVPPPPARADPPPPPPPPAFAPRSGGTRTPAGDPAPNVDRVAASAASAGTGPAEQAPPAGPQDDVTSPAARIRRLVHRSGRSAAP
jgi:curved DNA-binding protein CbpA